MLNMELSDEEANFVKISKAILDLVPKYIRSSFKTKWNEKHPEMEWQSDSASGEFLFDNLPEKVKKEKRNEIYISNLKKGNEQEWDTTTLAFVMLKSGLGLTKPCRAKDQRKKPLLISEAIDIIRETRNACFAHAKSMSCPTDVFASVMKDIKNAAICLADDAEKEIDELVSYPQIEVKMIVQLMNQVEIEKSCQNELKSILTEIRDDIEEIKDGNQKVLEVVDQLKVDVNKILEQGSHKDQSSTEEYINERSKVNRDNLHTELDLWKIHLINTNEDGKLFIGHKGKREKYTAKLRLFQTKTQSQAMPEELRMFMNKPKAEEGCLEYDELITAKEKNCFLRGVAGIGKTSLIEYLALKWAKRDLFLDANGNDLFDFLFLIKCRELEESKNETIEGFFKRKFGVDSSKLKEHGERILIIVDGIDEAAKLGESIRNDTKLQALLKRDHEFLKGHATIISGRPHIESVLNRVEDEIGEYKRIEVAGLSPTEIRKHIDVMSSGNKAVAKKIKDTIDSSSNMSALAAIPQYLGTICCVIAMQGEGAKLNTETMTPLYVWTLASFWIQYVQDKGHDEMGFKETFNDKGNAQLYIKISMISFELLKKNKIVFEEGDFPDINKFSKENQEMFNTFFIKKPSHTMPSYQFVHLTLQEFFAATHCMLNRIEIAEVLQLELYEVVRFIGGFIAAKESPDDRNIVKIYVTSLESAKEKQERSTDAVTFFNSVMKHFKSKSEFAQHYALSLFHEMFESANSERHLSLADLNIDIIPRFQDVVGEPAFVYYAMSQIALSDLVHFIESMFTNGLQHNLQKITVRIRFSSLENKETIKKLFKSFLFFKNVWFTGCKFASYPWEMMSESGISPVESKLAHLYLEGCNVSEIELNQLACVIPFAEKVELIQLDPNDANCQAIFDAIAKEHGMGRSKLRELRMVYCDVKDKFIYKFKSLKKKDVNAHFFK